MSRLRDLARAKANLRSHDQLRAWLVEVLGENNVDTLVERRLDDGTPVLREPEDKGFVFADWHDGLPANDVIRVYARLGMAAAEWHPVSDLVDLAMLEPVKKLPSRGPVS